MLRLFFVAVTLFTSTATVAGVEIGGSRVIYDGRATQASISVNNPDNRPYLIQAWVDKNAGGNNDDGTFVVTPPLFRLEAHTQNSVRIIYTGKPLPADRESMYWLSIKSIPSTSKEANNQLFITIKSVLKLFYRPATLSDDPATAYEKLVFQQRNGQLVVSNPTPYNISFYDLKSGNTEITVPTILAPHSEQVFPSKLSADRTLSWRVINDFGGITQARKVKL